MSENDAQASAEFIKDGVLPGAHVVKLQWAAVSFGLVFNNTRLDCDPVFSPETDHAVLQVVEL